MKAWEQVLIGPDADLRQALVTIDGAGTKVALVVDSARRLLGTVTDGDIRRGLIRGLELSDHVSEVMQRQPITASAHQPRDEILSLMRQRGVHQVPIVDDAGVVVSLETVDDFIVPALRDNLVVVMAGGLGTRLKELTHTTPKPMLRVGNRPILETILRSYLDQGFHRFCLAVNYKADVIEAHFGDGRGLGASISYLRETTRMGTAGALSLLDDPPKEPVFVTNADVLVKLDYVEMLEAHIASRSVATMAVREYEFQVPYGVVREDDGAIRRIEEKPVHRSLVSAGVYVLSPEVVRLVPRGQQFDMPALFDEVLVRGLPARCYRVSGYWVDIGRIGDLQKANEDFPGIFK